MNSNPPLRMLVAIGVATALSVAGCSSDSDDPGDSDNAESASDTTTTTTPTDDSDGITTSIPDDSEDPVETTTTTTTTTEPSTREGTDFPSGSVAGTAGTSAAWALSGNDQELCFDADLSNADAAIAETLGNGISDCLRPDGGLGDMEGSLSVSVGIVDGAGIFGYLWGRVGPEIISLTIEHTDGSQTPIDLISGPGGVQLFAIVVDTSAIPDVVSLDAVSGTQIEASEPIRAFLRAGPTYPITPTTTLEPDIYPTVG